MTGKINALREIGWDFYYSIYLESDKSYVLFSPNFNIFGESSLDSLKDEWTRKRFKKNKFNFLSYRC